MNHHLLQAPVSVGVQPEPGDKCGVAILTTVTTPAHQCPVILTIGTLKLTSLVRCQHLVICDKAY